MKGHRDLRLAVAASALCALIALAAPFDAVRLVFAAPLTLFLPGYAIVSATFASRSLERPQRLLLSVALSLTTLVLGSLVLNYVPGGLRAGSWALLLVLVVLAACREAALRRPAPPSSHGVRSRLPRRSAAAVGLLAGGALATAAALALAFTPLPAKHAIGYTELWMRPFSGGTASGVRVGVGSDERDAAVYSLRARFGNDPTPTFRSLTLKPGQTRVFRLNASQPASGAPVPVVVALFRRSQPGRVYRRVSGWIAAPGRSG